MSSSRSSSRSTSSFGSSLGRAVSSSRARTRRATDILKSTRVDRPSRASQRRAARRETFGHEPSWVSAAVDPINPVYLDDSLVLDVDGDGDVDVVDVLWIIGFALILLIIVGGIVWLLTRPSQPSNIEAVPAPVYQEVQEEYRPPAEEPVQAVFISETPPGDKFEVDYILYESIDFEFCEASEYGDAYRYCPVYDGVYNYSTDSADLFDVYMGYFHFEISGAADDWSPTWIYIFAEYEDVTQEDLAYLNDLECEPSVLHELYWYCQYDFNDNGGWEDDEWLLIYGEYYLDGGEEYWDPLEYVYFE